MFYPLVSGEGAFHTIASFSECAIWLLDTLVDVRNFQRRWSTVIPDSSVRIIKLVLSVVHALSENTTTSSAVQSKAITLLILLCSETISSPDGSPAQENADPDAQRIYCVALATIAKSSIRDRTLSRLAASKLVDEPLLLYPALAEDSDLWVSQSAHNFDCMLTVVQRTIQTLKYLTTVPLPGSVEPNLHPSKFQDGHIRKAIEALCLTYGDHEGVSDDSVKRRKISRESPHGQNLLMHLLHEALEVPTNPGKDNMISETEFL